MAALREKVAELERAAAQRKAKLDENSAFLQFNWKADVVESWIGTCTLIPPVRLMGGGSVVQLLAAEQADLRSAAGLPQ